VCCARSAAAPALAAAGTVVTRTGALRASSRSRSSLSKPFITDRMTMSAATPTHTPMSEAQVMKDTKKRVERART
jgi:hypothetical protein